MVRTFRDYLLVSGLCWLLHNAIVIATARAGASLALSIAASFVVTMPVGYAMHCLFSFRTSFGLSAFARYATTMSVNVPLAFVTLWLWRDLVSLPIELAAPLASGCALLVNFAMCRFAVFGRNGGRARTWAQS